MRRKVWNTRFRPSCADNGTHTQFVVRNCKSQNRKAAILENAHLRAVHDHYGNRSRSDNLVSHIANEQSI